MNELNETVQMSLQAIVRIAFEEKIKDREKVFTAFNHVCRVNKLSPVGCVKAWGYVAETWKSQNVLTAAPW